MQQRKDGGGITAVVARKSGEKQPVFFFTLKFEGPTAQVGKKKVETKQAAAVNTSNSISQGQSSPSKKNKANGVAKEAPVAKDPISVSMKERKLEGSVMSVLLKKDGNEDAVVFKLELKGKGAQV